MSGIGIIDVSDITKPKTLARYEYNPPHTEQTHTFLGVPHSIGGKRIAVSTEEERANRGPDHGKPHAPFRTWDVTDPTKPKILCTYELPEIADALRHQRRRGSARISSARSSTPTIFSTSPGSPAACASWTSAIRPIRRSAATSSRSRARAPTRRWTNDVYKDDRGLLFVTDKKRGLDVIEFKG